jgi:hypothetical protein
MHRSSNTAEPELSRTERLTRHTRLLFWLCYMSDKDLSLRTGHTPLLSDMYCDLTLPDNYENCYTSLRGLDEYWDLNDVHYKGLIPHFPGDPRLSHIKEKVYRTLYSARALKDTDGLLVHIRQLDDEIERWRLSIPIDFRPVLAIPFSTPLIAPGTKIPQSMHYICLQLEYHHLMTMIHTTVRRYSSAASGMDEEGQNFHTVIHSSVDLALEASRSTLWYIRELIAHLAEQAFR